MIQLARGILALLFLFGFAVGVTYLVMLWIYLGRVRKDEPAPNIVKPRFKLVSRHPFCRRWGCIDHVPAGGGYPGLPQSHCYRCGMINGHADKYRYPSLPDYDEPIGATFTDKMLMKLFPGKS
jgi:hypothetical protein